MPFNEKSRLDPTQVQDRRGRSTGTRMAIGGGGLGLLIVVVAMLMGVNPGDLTQLLGNQPVAPETTTNTYSDLNTVCQTGADANTSQDCAIVGYVNSIQAYWSEEFANDGAEYVLADTVLFTGATDAGACGYASSAMGPFYCPSDQSVYLDLTFFDKLRTEFGAAGGPFAIAYVLSHEYGHHIQNLLGVLPTSGGASSTGPQGESVMTELQADCLAGVWIHNAVATGYISQVSDQEIADSLKSAAAVGDDRIQSQTQGYVSPESWTHGSSDQREAALKDGILSGDIQTCNTPGT